MCLLTFLYIKLIYIYVNSLSAHRRLKYRSMKYSDSCARNPFWFWVILHFGHVWYWYRRWWRPHLSCTGGRTYHAKKRRLLDGATRTQNRNTSKTYAHRSCDRSRKASWWQRPYLLWSCYQSVDEKLSRIPYLISRIGGFFFEMDGEKDFENSIENNRMKLFYS